MESEATVVMRSTIAVIVRFHVYKIIGPANEDEAYTAMADLLMSAHLAALKAKGIDDRAEPFQAKEIIDAPNTNTLAFLRACEYVKRSCAVAPTWDGSPAHAFLCEMELAALPRLEKWSMTREVFPPDVCAILKRGGMPGSGLEGIDGMTVKRWRETKPGGDYAGYDLLGEDER